MVKVKEKDNLQGIIKVSLPITDYNLGYKHHLEISDDDIYYFIGKKATQGIEFIYNSKKNKTKEKQSKWDRNQIIEFAKTKMMPLVPDEFEFIPREYWCDFKELLGSNLNNESHPIWSISHRVLKDNYIKHSDTMLIQACGNYKPYIENPLYQFTLELHRKGYFDLFVCSWECVPIDMTPFFPYRYYDWSHAKETPFMTDACINHEFKNICDIVEYFDYKRLIIFAPGGQDHFYVELHRRLKNHFKNTIQIDFVWNDETIQKVKDDMNIHSPGIIKQRYNILKPGRDRLLNLINFNPNKIVPKEEWNYGIKNKELIQYLRQDKEDIWVKKDLANPIMDKNKKLF